MSERGQAPAAASEPRNRADAPEVSVVVATKDRCAMLARLLDGLERQTLEQHRFEVVVVDDGSRDGTRDLLERRSQRSGGRIRALAGAGEGPARARNLGWRSARGGLVAFTDDDCVPSPEWLERLLAAAASDRVLQGRTEPDPGRRNRIGTFSRTLEVTSLDPWYQTCNIAYPRDLLERLGGFDERFPRPSGEDTELALRARAAGATAVFVAPALVHHAVHPRSFSFALRAAWRRHSIPLVIRLHPEHREVLYHRLFWKRSHAMLILALAGAIVLRRRPPLAALTVLPYLHQIAGGHPLTFRHVINVAFRAPQLAAVDAVEIAGILRESARDRTLVI